VSRIHSHYLFETARPFFSLIFDSAPGMVPRLTFGIRGIEIGFDTPEMFRIRSSSQFHWAQAHAGRFRKRDSWACFSGQFERSRQVASGERAEGSRRRFTSLLSVGKTGDLERIHA